MTVRPYPFGFLVSDKPIADQEIVLHHFKKMDAWHDLEVYVQPDEPVQLITGSDANILWFGHAAFVGEDKAQKPFIDAAYEAVSSSWQAFHEFLDLVVGRWAALIVKDGKASVYNDTLASQPVYIARDESILFASHLPLLHRELNARTGQVEELINLGQYKLWDQTEDSRISALPPNFFFEFAQKKLKRFYPHKALAAHSLPFEEAINTSIQLAIRSVEHWNGLNYKVYCALTAGMDTRVCAASALAANANFSFVTYGSNEPPTPEDGNTKQSYKQDVQVSGDIAEAFNKQHTVLAMEDAKDFPLSAKEKKILRENTVGKHALNFQGLYENSLGTQPAICFVGTGLESLNDYFSQSRRPSTEFETFSQIVKSLGGFSKDSNQTNFTVDTARELWETFDLQSVEKYGYPVANALYQELRAGRFQSEAINCQATAFLPINPVAIRKIFELAQALSFYDRKNAIFAKYFIRGAFPPLTTFPVNGQEFSIEWSTHVNGGKVFSRTAEGLPAEQEKQDIPDLIQLRSENLHKGGEQFFRKPFKSKMGSIRITFSNHYNIGRDAKSVVIFIRVNGEDVYTLPIGKRNDPCTVSIDGLIQEDEIDLGIRSTSTNGPAWKNVSLLKLTEWQECKSDALPPQLLVASTRNFSLPNPD